MRKKWFSSILFESGSCYLFSQFVFGELFGAFFSLSLPFFLFPFHPSSLYAAFSSINCQLDISSINADTFIKIQISYKIMNIYFLYLLVVLTIWSINILFITFSKILHVEISEQQINLIILSTVLRKPNLVVPALKMGYNACWDFRTAPKNMFENRIFLSKRPTDPLSCIPSNRAASQIHKSNLLVDFQPILSHELG